jgi:hypothetical protein
MTNLLHFLSFLVFSVKQLASYHFANNIKTIHIEVSKQSFSYIHGKKKFTINKLPREKCDTVIGVRAALIA